MLMLKFSKWFFWTFILLALIPVGLAAQSASNFVYTNNDLAAGNSVSGFSLSTDGAGTLTPIAGSPFLTGGLGSGGGSYSPTRIIIVKGASNEFLYASNAGSNSVSGFTIESTPSPGALASIGSPIATAGANASGTNIPSGISLAATPDGHYLYAGTTDGKITIFSINSSTGVLTMVGTSPTPADGPMYSMKVSPNGSYLVLPIYSPSSNSSTPYGLDVFAIQTDGTLLPAFHSPFMFSTVPVTGVDINCASTLVFAGRAGPDIDVFNIDAKRGSLTESTGSPFSTSAASNQVVVLSPDDGTLYSSNQGNQDSNSQYTVTAFSVDPTNGALSSPITAGAGSSAFYTGGLAVGPLGSGLLYSGDTNAYVTSFGVGSGSTIQYDDSASTGQLSGMHSVAAYPPKTCAISLGLTATLQITTQPLGFDLEASLGLDPTLVVDPLTQAVTIQIGTFSFDLPAGSFKTWNNGNNVGTYLFQGSVGTTRLKVQITSLGSNQFQISAVGSKDDLTSLAGSSVTVTVGIGDNSASTTVTPTLAAPIQIK